MMFETRPHVRALLAFFPVTLIATSQAVAQSEATLTSIGDMKGGAFGSAGEGISGNGNIIVGVGESSRGREAFRWSVLDGMLGLESPLPEYTVTRATMSCTW